MPVKELILEEAADKVEKIIEVDLRLLREGRDLPPKIMAFAYCPSCNSLNASLSLLVPGDLEEYRSSFPSIVAEEFKRLSKCRGCGGKALPVGYAYFALMWMLETESYPDEEVEAYWKALSSIEEHPNKIEVYVALLRTALEEKVRVVMKRIERKGGGVEIRDAGVLRDGVKISSRFIVPLPKHDLERILKERGGDKCSKT